MKIALTHPTGNQNLRAILEVFLKENCLEKFYTTFAADESSSSINVLPHKIKQDLLRRSYAISKDNIQTFPFLEICRMILPKIGAQSLVNSENAFASIHSVYKNFDKKVASNLSNKSNIDAVYAYEDGALETFRMAKKKGIKCIYDLPIAYWETARKLLESEALRRPNWKITLGGGITDSSEKLNRKSEELELADIVVGPSTFVMSSLPNWAQNKKQIMSPFGSPLVNTEAITDFNKSQNQPLRILFVGSMGQRKGLGDLFEAIKLLNRSDVELVVMGSLLAPMEFYKLENNNFVYEPGRPHQEVLALMRSCDIFCLPSIVEGRALVMQEAMSQGLPIIITPNTGGEDLIIEGETGFLVPIASPNAIAEKINWFADNRGEIKRMRLNAINHSALYTWANYGQKIVNELYALI